MLVSFFGWFVQYPNVGHIICMFNEKNDDNKQKNLEGEKIKETKKIKCREIIFFNNRNSKEIKMKRMFAFWS